MKFGKSKMVIKLEKTYNLHSCEVPYFSQILVLIWWQDPTIKPFNIYPSTKFEIE